MVPSDWAPLGSVLELARLGLGELLRDLGPELHGRVAVALARAQARDGVGLDGEDADGDHGAVVLEDLGHADLAADQSDAAHHILISMSTPAASESRIRASTVFELGSRMSTSRLWVRISNCSRESLSMNGGPQDGELLDARRQRHRSDDVSAGALGGLDDLRRRLIEQSVVVGLEADADALLCHVVPIR